MWVGRGRDNFLLARNKDENYPRDGILGEHVVTDAQGRFEITGLDPAVAKRTLTASSAPGMPYQSASIDVKSESPASIECQRGISFRLKLIDEQEQPVEAEVVYYDVLPNPHAPRGFNYPCSTPLSRAAKNAEGIYQGFVVPGPGAILVKTSGSANYRPAYVDPKASSLPVEPTGPIKSGSRPTARKTRCRSPAD